MTVELNKEQKDVIDHKDGPVLVLAGPGTGKTMTIIERVEKLVDGGVDPKKIEGLTGILSSPFIHNTVTHLFNNF